MREGDVWRDIPGFPSYLVSIDGQIFNRRTNQFMQTSRTPAGHVKITLTDEFGDRWDRSVAKLVASEFVEPLDDRCDSVVLLDGDLGNVSYSNLEWRPRSYSFRYSRQFKVHQPTCYRNIPVRNQTTGQEYGSVIDAGISEGVLFSDIWRSVELGVAIYPKGHIFEVVE